jgi:hypothetical protein
MLYRPALHGNWNALSLTRRALKEKFPTPTVPLTAVLQNRQVFLLDPIFQSGILPSSFLAKILYEPSSSHYLPRTQKCRLLILLIENLSKSEALCSICNISRFYVDHF